MDEREVMAVIMELVKENIRLTNELDKLTQANKRLHDRLDEYEKPLRMTPAENRAYYGIFG